MEMKYRSSIMQWNPEGSDSAICRLLSGVYTADDMLEVIRVLDWRLAREERLTEKLLDTLNRPHLD